MYNNDNSGIGHWLIDILCLGMMYFSGNMMGRHAAMKEVEEKKQSDDIAELKKMFAEILRTQK